MGKKEKANQMNFLRAVRCPHIQSIKDRKKKESTMTKPIRIYKSCGKEKTHEAFDKCKERNKTMVKSRGGIKMKIIYMALILLMLSSGFVMADRVVPITNEITIDFRTPTSFILFLPGGLEKHYSWDTNQTHTDQNIPYTYNYILNEQKWCQDNSQLDEYKNISSSLVKMLTICGGVITAMNTSDTIKQQQIQIKKDKELYALVIGECKNSSESYKADSQAYVNKWQTCTASLTACERARGEYQTCNTDLTTALSAKNTFAFFGAIAGLAVGYFMWGRKQSSGPGEQEEAGYIADGTYEIPQRDYKQPTFKDGPRQ
jgi:hypothetical protein